MRKWSNRTFVAPGCGLLVAVIVIFAASYLDRENINKFQTAKRFEILEQIKIVGSRLSANLSIRQNVGTGISAFVRTGDSLTQQKFIEAWEILVGDQTGIKGVMLAPDAVVGFVSDYNILWPYIGKSMDDIFGPEILQRQQSHDSTGIIKILKLATENTPQIVNVLPILLKNTAGSRTQNRLWGYAAIVIDADEIFKASGLTPDRSLPLRFTLRDAVGTVLYQDNRPHSDDIVLYSVNLQGGNWTLAASPASPIGTVWLGRNLLWTFALFLSLSLGWFTWNLIIQPVRLSARVEAATEELRESEDRYRNLVELSDVGISIVQDGILRYANASFARYRDARSTEDVTGVPYTDFFHSDDRAVIQARMEGVLKSSSSSSPEEFRFLQSDGTAIPVEESGSRIIIDRAPALLSVCHDLSRQKAIQETLIATEQREQQALRRETQMRSDMERQAFVQEKIQALGTVAGGIAHSLNNLLAPIIGLTKLTLDDLPKEDPKHENLVHVMAAADDAKDIVGEILAFSRHEEDMELVTMPVSDALERAKPLLEAAVPRAIGIDVDIAPDAGSANLNVSQITNLILNLVSNAVDAMTEGPGWDFGSFIRSCNAMKAA